VTTQAGCAWTAAGNGAWLNPATPSGTGSATVTFGVLANPGASLREGTVTQAGVPVTITQAGASCSYSVTGTWTSVGPEQANAVVSVATATGCTWTAAGNGSWLNPATSSGNGSADVTFGVLANTSASARTGTVTLAGVGVTITQAGGCSYQVAGILTSVGSQQANASVGVTTQTGCAWSTASGAAWFTPGVASGTGSATVTVGVLPQPGSVARTGLVTIAGVAVSITQTGRVFGDVDGDGTADVSIWRPGDGTWQTLTTASSYQASVTTAWGSGASGDQPVPGDYDGDGRLDAAVWRGTTGMWSIRLAASGQPITVTWGSAGAGDVPVPADYDGDGKTDIAVWRAPEGIWYLLKSSALYQQSQAIPWGQAGDRPTPADFDGDGKADPAVWRTGLWQVLTSSSTYTAQISAAWGQAGDAPVPADYDGDGKADPAVWRGTTEGWFLLDSSTVYNTSHQYPLGRVDLGHRATPLDVDGDAKADLAVWGATDGPDGGWWIKRSSQGYAATQHFQWGSGAQSDRPVSLAPPALGTGGPGVCTYDVTPLTRPVGPGSETFDFSITTQAGCAWEAETEEGPITITSAASGVNSGTVSYAIAANPSSSSRTEALTIAGHTAVVTQAGIGGSPCTYTVTPTTPTVGYWQGTLDVAITTQNGCGWTAQPEGNFLTLSSTSPTSGSGSGLVTYDVQNNTAPEPRHAALDVAGQTVSVTQLRVNGGDGYCTSTLSGVATSATTGVIDIDAPPGCDWALQSAAGAGITFDGPTSGSGPASVTLSSTIAPFAAGETLSLVTTVSHVVCWEFGETSGGMAPIAIWVDPGPELDELFMCWTETEQIVVVVNQPGTQTPPGSATLQLYLVNGMNRTGLVGGLLPREERAHASTQHSRDGDSPPPFQLDSVLVSSTSRGHLIDVAIVWRYWGLLERRVGGDGRSRWDNRWGLRELRSRSAVRRRRRERVGGQDIGRRHACRRRRVGWRDAARLAAAE
jgi:hypothetical protein